MTYGNVWDIPTAMCITMFAAASVRDNSQALVMGSCLLGEDGGNRWELECTWLARLGQRRKGRCVFACVFVSMQACLCVVQNCVCSAIEKLKCDMNILSILPWKYLKIPLKGPHLGSLRDNTVQCPDDRLTGGGNSPARANIIAEYSGSHRRDLWKQIVFF